MTGLTLDSSPKRTPTRRTKPRNDPTPAPEETPLELKNLCHWAEHVLALDQQSPAKHHLLLMQYLDRVVTGDIDRLLILMPPGSAKSTYSSVLFPAWWLHRHPSSSIIAASHTANLAEHFGRRVRNVIARHGTVLGYHLAPDSHAAQRFGTTGRGEYFATGVNGPVIGRRADLILIDDPIKNHTEADSAPARDHVWNWYRSELITRLKPKGRIVVVMTRWHHDDLGGRLLSSGDHWHVLRLPALAEPGDPLRRAQGEALWPEWEDAEALERKRAAVGSRLWAAHYQQSPLTGTTGMFPAQRVEVTDAPPPGAKCVRAWDLAATIAADGKDPDWTVGIKLAVGSNNELHVLDIVRLRAGPHEVGSAIVSTAEKDGRATVIGIPQDPGQAGKQQVAWLTAQLAGFAVVASPETGSKVIRATPVAALVEAGRLRILRAPWNADFLQELADFPHGRKDDQVDALARAYSLISDTPTPSRRVQLSHFSR